MRRTHAGVALLVASGLLLNGCYGPFLLTKKLYRWNGQVSNDRWAVEAVFLICVALPIYSIAGVADALFLNSVEFWTGKNPLAASLPRVGETKRIVRGDVESVLQRVAGSNGEELVIDQYRHGQSVSHLRIRRDGEATVAVGPDGQTLLSAAPASNGGVVVADAKGKLVAAYSSEQVQTVERSLR